MLNLFLQDWGYEVLRTGLRELATRLLALRGVEVVWILAEIPVLLIASSQQQKR